MKPLSNFQQTTVEDAYDVGTATTTRKLFDLPNAHPISRIYIRERATHATSVDITQDLIEVLVDGSPIMAGLSGADVSKITKFDSGHQFTLNPSAGTDVEIEQMLHFGRFPRDESFFLPAPLFQNVQLRVNSTLTATPTAHTFDIAVEEILGVDPKKGIIRKRSLVSTYTPVASTQYDTKLPLGNNLSAVYVDYNDVDNVDGGPIQLGVNNFTRRVFDQKRKAIEAFNLQAYGFDDNAIPSTMFCLDFDQLGSTLKALPAGQGVSDIKLRTKASSSGVSGDVRVIAEEYIPVA